MAFMEIRPTFSLITDVVISPSPFLKAIKIYFKKDLLYVLGTL